MVTHIQGLYAITPDEANTDLLLKKVEAALLGGVSVLQYRNKAANHKLTEAQYNLDLMYYYGVGVTRDLTKAAQWYVKAANQGYAKAQIKLDAMYANGEC